MTHLQCSGGGEAQKWETPGILPREQNGSDGVGERMEPQGERIRKIGCAEENEAGRLEKGWGLIERNSRAEASVGGHGDISRCSIDPIRSWGRKKVSVLLKHL